MTADADDAWVVDVDAVVVVDGGEGELVVDVVDDDVGEEQAAKSKALETPRQNATVLGALIITPFAEVSSSYWDLSEKQWITAIFVATAAARSTIEKRSSMR